MTVSAAGIVTFPLGQPDAQTEVKALIGTAVDFAVPSWTREIDIIFDDMSTNGTGPPLVRIGPANGVEVDGYFSIGHTVTTTANGILYRTDGFHIQGVNAGNLMNGRAKVYKMPAANKWGFDMYLNGYQPSTNFTVFGNARKTISGALAKLRFTTAGGTDAFDSGNVQVTFRR
jgi:hypothetical protein